MVTNGRRQFGLLLLTSLAIRHTTAVPVRYSNHTSSALFQYHGPSLPSPAGVSVVPINLATGWPVVTATNTATHAQAQVLNNGGSTSASISVVGSAIHTARPTSAHGYEFSPLPSSPITPNSSNHTIHTTVSEHPKYGDTQMSNNDAITSANIKPTTALFGSRLEDFVTSTAHQASITSPPASSQNAISILLAALPSDVVSSLEAEYSIDFDAPSHTRTRHSSTSTPTQSTLQSSKSSTRHVTTLQSTSFTASPSSTTPSSTDSSTTLSTGINPSTISSAPLSSTTTPAPVVTSSHMSSGAIAGVVTGVAAGVVLIILAVVMLLRRQQQGKAPFGRRNWDGVEERDRAYPEIAWLYDPAPSPPNGVRHERDESDSSLIPQVREPNMAVVSNSDRPAGPESPLLPRLHNPPLVSENPFVSPNVSPRRSVRNSFTSSVSGGHQRSLHSIHEEISGDRSGGRPGERGV